MKKYLLLIIFTCSCYAGKEIDSSTKLAANAFMVGTMLGGKVVADSFNSGTVVLSGQQIYERALALALVNTNLYWLTNK